jgi:predicted short-subunit dehydrogenase-like oxidoreductase (DUF2520 family)
MTYNIIGTGNMGWFLVTSLSQAGIECKSVYGRNKNAAKELAVLGNGKFANEISELDPTADITILAIPDHAIDEVSKQLSGNNSILVHTAGAVPIDNLPSVERGVLWFIYSIVKDDLPAHRNIPAIWEASSARSSEAISALASAISDIVYQADWEKRKWLHLAAVFGNNFSNHLFTICEQLAITHGLSFDLLLPILHQTIERLDNNKPFDIQTGPAKRGDLSTQDRHLELLNENPAWQDVYHSLSASIEDMYKKNPKENS